MAKSPTVEDVARLAGVSRQTVSNVLNAPEVVKQATREKVQQAILDLAYRPHAAARNLRTRRSSTIGIRLDPYLGGISGVVLDRFVHALTDRAGERGMRMLVYSATSPSDELDKLAELSDGAEIDASVITGTSENDPRATWLLDRQLPFVAFGRPWGDGDAEEAPHAWVDIDGAAGTRGATEWALAAAGPQVAFLGWHSDHATGDDRRRGWADAMRARGITAPTIAVADDVATARTAMSEFLERADSVLDAVVCTTDALAVGAHLALADAGRHEVPVVGFDNTPVAEALGISSVEQVPEVVATACLDLLLGPDGQTVQAATAEAAATHILIEPRLVLRR